MQALDAYLQCTGQAERELPAPEGREAPEEADIKATAEVGGPGGGGGRL